MQKGQAKSKTEKQTIKAANANLQQPSQVLASKSMLESKGKLHAASRAPRRKGEDGFQGLNEEGDSNWAVQPKTIMKPDDQLQLSEQALKEEITRVLSAENPHAPNNIVRFNFKERVFKQISSIDHLAFHFTLDSNLLHNESDEGRKQLAKKEGRGESNDEEEKKKEEEEGKDEKETGDGPEGGPPNTGAKKLLRNQFNFSERASQTLNNPLRNRETTTEPPPRATFSANANQMEIFDAYVENLIEQAKAKEKKAPKSGAGSGGRDDKRSTTSELQSDDITRVAKSAKIMERMVNQNIFDEISQDFKYYDDPADEFKDGLGTILPLWRFRYEKARKMAITALCWNPLYKDLFAVGHGSYDFTNQGGGLICFHSLKNPSYPEYVFQVDSGVMSLDIHPEHPYLIAVGLYDGTVAVYTLKDKGSNPLYRSTAKTGKHTDPVWQVCWQKNNLDGNINFYSVSSDGRVVNWSLVKNELQYQDTVKLEIPESLVEGPEGTTNPAIGSGTAIAFNPVTDHLFIIGTEEGRIYKCSKAYTGHFLGVYEAHHTAVQALHWNPFHQNVFASCGADWTVKIWDHTRKDPMFTFDLNSMVGDVAWAPYCSTVFAAVTTDGKVHIFDLSVNKYEPLCVQSVIQKKHTKLTHVVFNPSYPILIVGDDRGCIISLKLSPNLRKALQEKNSNRESEIAKMEKLVTFVKEPLLEKEVQTMPAL